MRKWFRALADWLREGNYEDYPFGFLHDIPPIRLMWPRRNP